MVTLASVNVGSVLIVVRWRERLRTLLAEMSRSTPAFRGKGRVILALDRILTDSNSAESYLVSATINGLAILQLDLRAWGQKFAYYYGHWEKPYVEQLAQLYIYEGGGFIDVGSSLGLYTCCLGEAVKGSRGIIWSFEPVAFNLEKQRGSISLNLGLEEIVELFPFALGSTPGFIRLQADPQQADNNAYQSDEGDIKVQIRTLDELMSERGWPRIGAVKMDIEGWEPDVIQGAKATLIKSRPILLCEFNRERMRIYGFDMGSVLDFLVAELKYRPFELRDSRLCEIDEVEEEENIFFIPSGHPYLAMMDH
jgi:FkbM family methyltransferase